MMSSRTPVALRTRGNSTTADIAIVKAQALKGGRGAAWNPRTVVSAHKTVDVHTRKRASEETPVRYVKKRRPHPPHCFPPHPLFLLPAFSHLPEALFNNQRISWTLSTLRVTPPSGPVATIRRPYGPRPQALCNPRLGSASIWVWTVYLR